MSSGCAPTQTSRFRRNAARALTLAGTLAIAALAVGAVILASDVIAQNSVRIAVDEAAEPLSVSVIAVARQDGYGLPQEFTGRVEPRQATDLGFETGGTVAEILVDEGDHIKRGARMARLDTRSLEAQANQQRAARDALAAQLELARLTFERQKALADRSFASQQRADEARLSVAELEARLAESDAALAGIAVQLDKAELRAPFDGQVAARYVDNGARVAPSVPVFDLHQDAAPQVRVGLTPSVVARLTRGDSVALWIEGMAYRARYASRSAELDPVTRTLPVLFDLEPVAGQPLPPFGAVVRLRVERQIAEPGAWLPLSTLTEGPRGLWTVLVVGDTGDGPVVQMEAVEVIHAEEDRAYVRGALDDGAQVIADGTHRVAAGQRVQIATGG